MVHHYLSTDRQVFYKRISTYRTSGVLDLLHAMLSERVLCT
jgi:hypothetical protein